MTALIAFEPITALTDLGDGLTVWINSQGELGYALDIHKQWSAYFTLRRRLARKTLTAEEGPDVEPWGDAHVNKRATDFERIIGSTLRGPESWRWAIERLMRRKEALFDAHRDAQRRAQDWYDAQTTAFAAD